MKYTSMKDTQKKVKEDVADILKRHEIASEVSVELGGHLNGKSEALICIAMLKPDCMCSKEDFTAENFPKSYPADMLPDFYNRILMSCAWDRDEYGYEVMPLSDEAKAACDDIKKYAEGVFDELFDNYNLWINVWFKTREELNG